MMVHTVLELSLCWTEFKKNLNKLHRPQHATVCPWRWPHDPRSDACRLRRSARPSYHGRGGSRVPLSARERQLSAPYCNTDNLKFTSLTVNGHSRWNNLVLYWPTVTAVEVVGMVGVVFENEGLFLDDGVTLLTDVLPEAPSFLTVMAWTAEMAGKSRYATISKGWFWLVGLKTHI